MKRILLSSVLFLIINKISFAQPIVSKVQGTPVVAADVNVVEGSPYMSNSFNNGSFTLADGTIVSNVRIKFNLLKDIVIYQDEKGAELQPLDPIKKFTLQIDGKELIFQKGFPDIENFKESTYYEVLNKKGIPMILKKRNKVLLSRKEYNSSKITDTYLDNIKYYVYTESGEMLKLKNDKNSLSLYFPNKLKEMLDYMNKQNIKLKDNDDLAQLFDYYITIK